MSRSQRPGGLTALAYINLMMIVSYGFGLFIKFMQFISNRSEVVENYGSISLFLVNIAANAMTMILFLLVTIGIFKASRALMLYGGAVLLILLATQSALMMTMAPSTFGMINVTGLAYGLMLAGLSWTVFRRDFDSGRTQE